MIPRIETIAEKKLVGLRTELSLANDTTVALWQKFMPMRGDVKNRIDNNYYSMQVYPRNFSMANFTPKTIFIKWAAVEVQSFDSLPKTMRTFILKGGLYAIFRYKGLSKDFSKTLQYIFTEWLPNSEYLLDDREHFELLGEDYIPNHPASEEDVYIPIKPK